MRGAQFLARHLPLMANMLWYWGAPAFWQWHAALARLGVSSGFFLPDPYGWLLFSKLVLYMLIVLNGALIERRYLPYVFQACSGTPGAHTALHLTAAWSQVKVRARLNLLLVLIVVAPRSAPLASGCELCTVRTNHSLDTILQGALLAALSSVPLVC